MARCLFCPDKADSREHIWADWLKAYVPRTDVHYLERVVEVEKTGAEETLETRKRSGDPRSRKIRVACIPCNSGWMSRLQTAAKPHLVPLVRGEACTLSMSGKAIVSGWIALLVTVAERKDHPRYICVTEADRAWIKANKTAPPNWHVWVGQFESPDGGSRFRRDVLPVVASKEDIPEIPLDRDNLPYNTEAFTFLVGQLFVHVIVAPDRLNFTFAPSIARKLVDISTVTGASAWPPAIINDEEYFRIAGEFQRRAIKRG